VKRETIESHLEELAKLADCDDGQKIRQALKRIVPEYQINGNGNGNSVAAEPQTVADHGTS
jgi:hypothetical protein